MKINKSNALKSMAIGLTVGGATAAVSSAVMGNNGLMKKAKKSAAKAIKTVNSMMDNVSSVTNMKF